MMSRALSDEIFTYDCSRFHEKEKTNSISAFISVIMLGLLCLLGFFGNILVLMVYCIPKRNRSWTNEAPEASTSKSSMNRIPSSVAQELTAEVSNPPAHRRQPVFVGQRRKTQSTQANLILALAVVDLFTIIGVLPIDIFRTVCSSLVNCQVLEKTSNKTSMEFDTNILPKHLLSDFLDATRNVAFACEGSILASIALNRFLIVIQTTNKKDQISSIRKQLNTLTNFLQSPCTVGKLNEERHMKNSKSIRCNFSKCFKRTELMCVCAVGEKKSDWMLEEDDNNCCFQCFMPNISPTKAKLHHHNHSCRDKLLILFKRLRVWIVWGVIIFTTIIVFAFECLIFFLHYIELNKNLICGLSSHLRMTTDMIYFIFAFIAIFIISLLYLQVFFKVRRHVNRNKQSLKSVNQQLKLSKAKLKKESSLASMSERTVKKSKSSNVPLNTAASEEISLQEDYEEEKRKSSCLNMREKIVLIKNESKFRRTGLMLFMSTVIFYVTLMPFLWAHLDGWLSKPPHNNSEYSSFINYSSRVVQLNETGKYETDFGTPHVSYFKTKQMLKHHEFYYLNNALNVFIYSWLNPKFRHRLQNLRRA